MGNTHSSKSHSTHSVTDVGHNSHGKRKDLNANPAALKCFAHIAGEHKTLKKSEFEKLLGPKIGTLLWEFVFGDKDEVDEATFSQNYYELSDITSTQCCKIFPDVESFLDACLSTAHKDLKNEDAHFIKTIVHDVEKEGSAHWFSAHCPGLAQYTIIQHARNVFSPSSQQIIFASESTILTPLQMFLVQGSLSESIYFKHKQAKNPCWSTIYESSSQGLSTNRFEANVFGYSAPTAAIFKLTDGKIFVIATNTEWRHSTKFIGSSLSKCIQIYPQFKFIESRHEEPILCNFKLRSGTLGLGFRDVFTIEGDFKDVDAIEVWGCGNEQSSKDMKSLKQRQQMQAERNQKVPLPGNWDENPDKQILEMGGFTFLK
ncbi:TLDc domain-containing protein [Aphelenchoides bicaudatus]|nr:TLDc domain-containing protein [Aphelenchoides bicaudatus]